MTGILGAVCMSNVRVFNVTVGTSGTLTGFLSGTMGSVSPTTYKDNAGTTQTINAFEYDSSTTKLIFSVTGVVTNSDAIFVSHMVNGVQYQRSAATFSTAGGNSTWTWTLASTPYGSNRAVFLQ